MTGERLGYMTVVPSVQPVTSGVVHAGTWISMKNYERVTCVMQIGATAGDTQTLRLRQATTLAGAGAAALNFEAVYRTGARLYFDPATRVGDYVVGEVVTGAGAGASTIAAIYNDHLLVYAWNNTVYVANEVITGAGGATANLVAANFFMDQDTMVRVELPAAIDTVEAPADINKQYAVDIKTSDLNVNGGYDCIQADISAVGGAGNTDKSVFYILSQPRYAGMPQQTVLRN